ncbi:hypothetical protein AVEN_116003-1 [Araneus ventricosus]|uniref:Uncharacterized protein n=1 Tax=Araneus ventricosus TaxID=182803 RepID=A0A4Y2EMV6_ARAVE|nr:hypothetical protein AVEN_116003-1 [Araneus ventricosus]
MACGVASSFSFLSNQPITQAVRGRLNAKYTITILGELQYLNIELDSDILTPKSKRDAFKRSLKDFGPNKSFICSCIRQLYKIGSKMDEKSRNRLVQQGWAGGGGENGIIYWYNSCTIL